MGKNICQDEESVFVRGLTPRDEDHDTQDPVQKVQKILPRWYNIIPIADFDDTGLEVHSDGSSSSPRNM